MYDAALRAGKWTAEPHRDSVCVSRQAAWVGCSSRPFPRRPSGKVWFRDCTCCLCKPHLAAPHTDHYRNRIPYGRPRALRAWPTCVRNAATRPQPSLTALRHFREACCEAAASDRTAGGAYG